MSEAIELAKKYGLDDALPLLYKEELEAFYAATYNAGIQRGRELEREESSKKQEPFCYVNEAQLHRFESFGFCEVFRVKSDLSTPLYAKPIPKENKNANGIRGYY